MRAPTAGPLGHQVGDKTSTLRRTKPYRDLSIDAALDTRLLDRLNAFAPRVQLVSTCAGHPDGAHFTLEARRQDVADLVTAIPLVDSIHVTVFETPTRGHFTIVVAPNYFIVRRAWWRLATMRAVRAMRRLERGTLPRRTRG